MAAEITRHPGRAPEWARWSAIVTVGALLLAGTHAVISGSPAAGRPVPVRASGALALTTTSTSTSTTPATTAPSVPVVAPAPATAPERSTAPYAVGIATVTLVDPSRPTAARGTRPATGDRAVTTVIRYPATGTGEPGVETPGADAASGEFPLVVFAHGYATSSATYAALLDDLTATGHIVAAPEFPLTSTWYDGPPDRSDIVNQAADVSLVISRLVDGVGGAAGRVDPTRIAVLGHSDGGITAAAVAYNSSVRDERVDAAVILSGAAAFYPGPWFADAPVPLLAVHGTADTTNPFAASQSLYARATGPRALLAVPGGSHLDPFTTGASREAVAATITDFLRVWLDGDGAAADDMDADAASAGLPLTIG
jgi:predicted dienelactone hydrolase